MSADSGFDFDVVPKRVESLAKNEADIVSLAIGIGVKNIPMKVVNPDTNDYIKFAENCGIRGKLNRKIFGFSLKGDSSGLTDPVDNIIYDINGSKYMSSIFGVDWELLEGVTEVSLHEFGHSWLIQTGDPRLIPYEKKSKVWETDPKLLSEDEIEPLICVKIVSEGVATYIAKRANDYIRDTMVKAVGESIPGGLKEARRCAEIFSQYYDNKIYGGDTIEEDVALISELAKILNDGNLISRFRNIKFLNEFYHTIVYRLGYNLVAMEVGKNMERGMTEAQAMLCFAKDPPMSINDIKKRLRVEN